jgi:hypothetical protein
MFCEAFCFLSFKIDIQYRPRVVSRTQRSPGIRQYGSVQLTPLDLRPRLRCPEFQVIPTALLAPAGASV